MRHFGSGVQIRFQAIEIAAAPAFLPQNAWRPCALSTSMGAPT
jgi:hypothetical protein